MTLSLNEVEALAKKAARGVGYPWGLAEEAAKATRWLCGRSVDGCAELAGLLSRCDGSDLADWAPMTGNAWSARGETLCPITTGAALSDRSDALATCDLRIENVAHPMLLAPFAGLSARHLDTTVALSWDDTVVTTDGEALSVRGYAESATATVTVTTGGAMDAPRPGSTRADPDPATFERLSAFAHRTYAPATEESRIRGAGAGLSDND